MIGFLPLAHVFELLVESVCLLSAVPIGYSSALTMIDSGSKIKKGSKGDATVLHPSCMTSVPLILDRISKSIQEKVNKSSTIKKYYSNLPMSTKKLGREEAIAHLSLTR
ncbi:hypothetical protein HHI36_005515 [Cryptolaemus montrouzieri]|uniref:AMP-dependent synthetase/ligase domain-containing protein n=1 Tax=Cryptolaemus montrouzieri TaxID=559131 RepID=A0ABD2NUF6_9CUCU